MNQFKRAIIVGASSGIGAELARQLARANTKVAIVARRQDRLDELKSEFPEQILAYAHDVTHFDEVPNLFLQICQDLGGLDLIIYSAGSMPPVDPDEFDFSKDEQIIDVNVKGAIGWLNEAAQRFQGAKHGTIVGIGSVAGDRGRAGNPVYNTSKAALATYLEALRNRLSKSGVTVVTIKPGPVETDMTSGLNLKKMMPADLAARLILKKSMTPGEKYLSPVHWIIFTIIRHIPSPIFRRLKI